MNMTQQDSNIQTPVLTRESSVFSDEPITAAEFLEILNKKPEPKIASGDVKLRFGKHEGKTLDYMVRHSRDTLKYLVWVKSTTTSEFLKRVIGEVLEARSKELA